jgi:hypothetical protein
MAHRDEVIREFQEQILAGTWMPGEVKHKTICERGKQREIDFISIRNGIALHAIMTVVERYIDRTLIADTGASIKGRGGLYLLRRIIKARKAHPEDTCIVYKADIRKFYENVSQEMVMADLRHLFKDAKLLAILERCVYALGSGLSIGLRSSQALANLLLSIHLDHILKDRCREKFHYRYCDDTVGLAGSMFDATRYIRAYRQSVADAGLEVKDNEQMYSIDARPLDFLGYRLHGDGRIMLRKHIKHRFALRWHRVRSKRRKRELIGSFYGMAKHADAGHLFHAITGRSMMRFSEIGFDYHRADGKKEFDVPKWQLKELSGHTVVIEDFETGLTTSQGDGRYLVLFSDGGRKGKFWTNKDKMKQALDYARREGMLPFEATIQNDGQYGYVFA